MGSDKRRRIALVLSGGGARGAYQAGVVKALGEISHECGQPDIFKIVTGVSAGAINASYIASRSTGFLAASRHLAEIWEELTINDVFRTDLRSLSSIGLQWVSDVVTSGALGNNRANSLLDTAPLFRFIDKHVDFDQISENLHKGVIDALAVTATDYSTSENVTFVSSAEPFAPWRRTRRMSEAAQVTIDHVGASAAIPLFFPPVRISERYYGDGCLRNTAPLSPGIHLGADSLIVVGVQFSPAQTDARSDSPYRSTSPSIARVLSVLLNSVMLDGVGIDVERLHRINNTLRLIPDAERHKANLRVVDCLHISPSQNISEIAYQEYERLPRSVRYLIGGLGSKDDAGNLVSYILFVPSYCKRLTNLGYEDAMRRREAIKEVIHSAV